MSDSSDSKLPVKLMGLFDSTIGEIYEMLYQNEADCIFDSSRIERAFGIPPLPSDAITQTVSDASVGPTKA